MASFDPKETASYIVKTFYTILSTETHLTDYKIQVHSLFQGIPTSAISKACVIFNEFGLIEYVEKSNFVKTTLLLTPNIEEALVNCLLKNCSHAFLIPSSVLEKTINEINNYLSNGNEYYVEEIVCSYPYRIKKYVLDWLELANLIRYRDGKYYKREDED